ncbi:MAG: hypothetical protein HY062_17830 [Bacteroidetes bacterium]|nr:hypothetical protein [Bacteroidota bacterium]
MDKFRSFPSLSFAQSITLHSIKGTYRLSDLTKRKNFLHGHTYKRKMPFRIHQRLVLDYTDSTGKLIIVNDSVIFSRLPEFNKPYPNLKPISNARCGNLIYNQQTLISERDFLAISQNINHPDIQHKLKIIRRNKRFRPFITATSITTVVIGTGIFFTGLINSSGRDSYPQEQREQAANLTQLGFGIMTIGATINLGTILINCHDHKIIHKDLVNLYNQQL